LRTATSGVITGIMLAFARVAGETAPLLFTAFGNQYWNWKMNQPRPHCRCKFSLTPSLHLMSGIARPGQAR